MVYLLSTDFTKINETAGTIQNASHINTIEMAASSVKGSGILIYPLQSTSFCGDNVYLRGVDGAAEARVLSAATGLVTDNVGAMQSLLNAFYDFDVVGGELRFKNYTGNVVKIFNIPEEIFVKQLGTQPVRNFIWSDALYPNSTNPNLDGKFVITIHVTGDNANNPYEDWYFINLQDLIDVYVPADMSIAVVNNSISAGISSVAGNQLTKAVDGLLVAHDNTKADKVSNATNGNIVLFDASGNIADSGYSLLDVGLNSSSDISDFRNELKASLGLTTMQGGNS